MERFFHWRSKAHGPKGDEDEALVICYNDAELSVPHAFNDIETALKSSRQLPDCVYILGTSHQLAVFNAGWADEQTRLQGLLKRGVKNSRVCVHEYVFLEWNGVSFVVHVLGDKEIVYRCQPRVILRDGLRSLIEKNNVIHSAPSSHSFKHPSGTLNNVFIQARELATDEAEVSVIGYAIALEYGEKLRKSGKVYIDTMGIYPFVKNALTRVSGNAEVMSFHSYEKLKTMYPPSGNYFCIISASTSGGMARKMEEQAFAEKCVATLIDRTADGRYGKVLVPLDAIKYKLPIKPDEGCTLIEIIGENFSAKSKPPKAVLISLKHNPKHLSEFHKHFGMEGIEGFNTSGVPRKLLRLNPQRLLNHVKFKSWLNSEIDWSVSLATNLIVHPDDVDSKALGEEVLRQLQNRLGSAKQVKLVAYSDLENINFNDVTGVLVVTVVARDGGVLREISRDLRAYMEKDVPRRFLAPVAIPKSSQAWLQLKSLLSKNPTPRDYGFSNWLCLPIGDDGKENSWSRLVQLCSDVEFVGDGFSLKVLEDVRNKSLDLASETLESNKHSLLPKYDGSPLGLSDGFLFFADGSDVAEGCLNVPQSTVYLTIAAVLQHAREHDDHELRLQPTGYESVVLSPECFLRFNDNVLQACFLRACLPSELDYSANPELSKLMKELIAKIFARWERNYGDAALDFAAAIASGSLRLTLEDTKTLLNDAIEHRKQTASSLLGLLLMAQRMYFPDGQGSA